VGAEAEFPQWYHGELDDSRREGQLPGGADSSPPLGGGRWQRHFADVVGRFNPKVFP
jgi:hypothetical protein